MVVVNPLVHDAYGYGGAVGGGVPGGDGVGAEAALHAPHAAGAEQGVVWGQVLRRGAGGGPGQVLASLRSEACAQRAQPGAGSALSVRGGGRRGGRAFGVATAAHSCHRRPGEALALALVYWKLGSAKRTPARLLSESTASATARPGGSVATTSGAPPWLAITRFSLAPMPRSAAARSPPASNWIRTCMWGGGEGRGWVFACRRSPGRRPQVAAAVRSAVGAPSRPPAAQWPPQLPALPPPFQPHLAVLEPGGGGVRGLCQRAGGGGGGSGGHRQQG